MERYSLGIQYSKISSQKIILDSAALTALQPYSISISDHIAMRDALYFLIDLIMSL